MFTMHLYKKMGSAIQSFSGKSSKNIQNTFFPEHLSTAASIETQEKKERQKCHERKQHQANRQAKKPLKNPTHFYIEFS